MLNMVLLEMYENKSLLLEQLAKKIGVSSEMMSFYLQDLERLGYLSRSCGEKSDEKISSCANCSGCKKKKVPMNVYRLTQKGGEKIKMLKA